MRQSINDIVREVKNNNFSVLNSLDPNERDVIISTLDEICKGKSNLLASLWEYDYEHKPVSIDTFLDEDYYLGKIGSSIYPLWRDELRYVHNPKNEVNEWIIRGCIGSGKTYVAVLSMLYSIYKLSCMKDPQAFYGLASGSPIVFGLFNIYKYLAQATSYQYLINMTKLSPYFQLIFKKLLDSKVPKWLKDTNSSSTSNNYIYYPKNIILALGAQAIHAIGLNVFGGLCDEADMSKRRSVSNEERSQIADLYSQIKSRMDSRFLQENGLNPGMLCLVSQVRGKDSFLESHIKKVSGNKHTHVSSFSLWEVKSHIFSKQETFKVVVGDKQTRSFIAKNEEELNKSIRKNLRVISVPESLRLQFEYDTDGAIRDLAGIATYGTDLFLPRRDKLFECYELSTKREHPFSCDTVELSIEPNDSSSIIDVFEKNKCMTQFDKATGNWKPKYFPNSPRAIHVDLAAKKDCAGISMGCLGDTRSILRFDKDERPYTTTDYSLFIDLALRISAAKGSEIDFSKIRQFIYYLKHIGFPVAFISYDGWQSVDSMQQMKKAGFDVKLISVDKTPIPYNYLRSAIVETRLDIYEYGIFTTEITALQDFSLTNRKPAIDHPENGSKDVSDGVCGVVTRLYEVKEILYPSFTNNDINSRIDYHFGKEKKKINIGNEIIRSNRTANEFENIFK